MCYNEIVLFYFYQVHVIKDALKVKKKCLKGILKIMEVLLFLYNLYIVYYLSIIILFRKLINGYNNMFSVCKFFRIKDILL